MKRNIEAYLFLCGIVSVCILGIARLTHAVFASGAVSNSSDENGLFGSLPTELFFLTDLLTLSLGTIVMRKMHPGSDLCIPRFLMQCFVSPLPDKNSLTGAIPSELGLLTNLEGLFLGSLSYNPDFQGPIPSEIGLLSSLMNLHLRKFRSRWQPKVLVISLDSHS